MRWGGEAAVRLDAPKGVALLTEQSLFLPGICKDALFVSRLNSMQRCISARFPVKSRNLSMVMGKSRREEYLG